MKQTGSIILYALLALAVLGALSGIYYKVHHDGYLQGVGETTAKVALRDKEQQDKIASLESNSKKAVDVIIAAHQKELKDVTAKKDRALAAAHAGTLQLRVQLAASTTASNATTATPGVCDAAPTTGLLGEADAAFLINEAARADEVVLQLQEAQRILIEDRKAGQ